MAEQAGKAAPKKGSRKPDVASFGGLLVALGGLIGGLLLEGGSLKQISQLTAAMIVLGGTIGAVMISTPMHILVGAVKRLGDVFFELSVPLDGLVEMIIGYAQKARKNGLVSLEEDAEKIDDPFLGKALNLAVDGTDLQELRKMLELEMAMEEHKSEAQAKVWEAAGGYAPTIGIIGAVMGLIQVMGQLENIEKVGEGIAVAFVATVYGVASANLLFLPAAAKIKARAQTSIQRKELIVEGVSAIVEGLNPKLIRVKLEAFLRDSGAKPKSPVSATNAKAPSPRAAEAEG
jgi:chemotaxis protein MotA